MQYIIFTSLMIVFLIALGVKWEIKLKIVIPWAVFVAALGIFLLIILAKYIPDLSLVINVILSLILGVVVTASMILLLFYRDPKRVPPDKDNIIISPADGTIIYIKEIQGATFPFSVKGNKEIPLLTFTDEKFLQNGGYQIGIMMSYLDVHVNRTPIEGRIEYVKRIPGFFSSLKHISSLLENERVFIVIKGETFKVGLVQIASRLVRKIIPFVKDGDYVQQGQKLGVIHFGSQVDILLPKHDTLTLHVKQSEYVKAGTSIIATY